MVQGHSAPGPGLPPAGDLAFALPPPGLTLAAPGAGEGLASWICVQGSSLEGPPPPATRVCAGEMTTSGPGTGLYVPVGGAHKQPPGSASQLLLVGPGSERKQGQRLTTCQAPCPGLGRGAVHPLSTAVCPAGTGHLPTVTSAPASAPRGSLQGGAGTGASAGRARAHPCSHWPEESSRRPLMPSLSTLSAYTQAPRPDPSGLAPGTHQEALYL